MTPGNVNDSVAFDEVYDKVTARFPKVETSVENFKQELIKYLDYYSNGRNKVKLEDLPPAVYRRQALLAA